MLLFARAQAQGAKKRGDKLDELRAARAMAAQDLDMASKTQPIAGGEAREKDRLAALERLKAAAVEAARNELDAPAPDALAKVIAE